jgi:hypothetical protein
MDLNVVGTTSMIRSLSELGRIQQDILICMTVNSGGCDLCYQGIINFRCQIIKLEFSNNTNTFKPVLL